MAFDTASFWAAIRATEPEPRAQLSKEKVMEYYQYFAAQLPLLINQENLRFQCEGRMESLQAEIQFQSAMEQSNQQHQQSLCLQRWTLFWAVAATVVPGILVLVSHILSPKPQPAKIDLKSSPTSLQTPAPKTVLPVPEASSNTATPSPEQTATAQPSSTTPLPSASP
jgi:hypothetical protein